MIKYLVKLTSVATEKNVNFFGITNIYYYGRCETVVAGRDNDMWLNRELDDPLTKYFIKEYGYNRICDAKRSYIYKRAKEPDCYGYWDENAEIIKVEV